MMPDPPPPGLGARPLAMPDAGAVHRLIAAQEVADLGRAEIEEADIVGDWQRPSFVVEEQTVGLLDGDRLVGYAEVGAGGRGDAAVHPGYRGRGVGTWLAAWSRLTARRRGESCVGMPVPVGSAGDRLLASLGYYVRWTSWVLRLPPGARVPDRALPAGHVVRAARPEELRVAHDVLEDAFLEWSRRARESFEEFEAAVLRRPGFEGWNLRVVLDDGSQVVAAAVVHPAADDGGGPAEAFVARLAVRRDRRGEGLAQALLVDAFARAREHGCEECSLSTDSRTGALGLYERVGMRVDSTWVHRAIDLA